MLNNLLNKLFLNSNSKQLLRPLSIVFTGLLSVAVSQVTSADENFWQSPFDHSEVGSIDSNSGQSVSLSSNQGNYYNHSPREITSLNFDQVISSDSSYAMQYSRAQEQNSRMMGFTHKNLSLSYIQGDGEDYAQLEGAYAGIDPYQFHAGLRQSYRYDGYALDYATREFGNVQFGQATVKADNLLDRKASYFEWSNDRVFLRASEFDRGGQSIGSGFDAGMAFGSNKYLAYQAIRMDTGATLSRVRLQLNSQKSTRQYWLDLSSQRNPLFQDSNDVSIMFSFKTNLGTNKLINYATESTGGVDEEGVEETQKSSGWKRPVFIGAGIGAAALLASSGGGDRDEDTTRFASQQEAAFNVLNRVNPLSVDQNVEYGGWVVINQDGSYSPTATVTGDNSSVTIPGSLIPIGTRPTATIHTHAAFDPRFDNENFSPTDLEGDRRLNLDGYLGTPGGQFKYHEVATGNIVTLGRIAN